MPRWTFLGYFIKCSDCGAGDIEVYDNKKCVNITGGETRENCFADERKFGNDKCIKKSDICSKSQFIVRKNLGLPDYYILHYLVENTDKYCQSTYFRHNYILRIADDRQFTIQVDIFS